MSLLEPQIIDEQIGNFRVVELIGHGGMASVYRGFDVELERDVALKIPDPKYIQSKTFAERFNREAKAMAKLCHRNIVQIYSVGDYEGIPFMAMEYVQGASLAKIMTDREKIEVDEAIEYLLQVCEAMECAHQRNIVHRDLKPSNILVESSGRVMVADFGISKIVTGNTCEDTLTFAGTPIYMSPEQCGEGVLDQRTDIYSLGVIFFEMVFGRPPFNGDSPAEIIKGHLMDTPKFPNGVAAQKHPKILKIIRKMLTKNPEQRYPDARSLIHELELWKKEAPTNGDSARPKSKASKSAPTVLCFIPQKILFGAVVSALKNIDHNMVAVPTPTDLTSRLSTMKAKMAIISHQPGNKGVFAVAERIRSNPKNTDVQLILLSHGISRDEVEAAFKSGINDIIAEPFDPSILVSKLEGALVGSQRSIESRRFFRKQMTGNITVRIGNEILDISEGGMRIATNMTLQIGEIVKFELDLFRKLGFAEKAGKVVWISKTDDNASFSFQAGVDFVDVTRAERDILRKWIFSSEINGRKEQREEAAAKKRESNMGVFTKRYNN